MTGGAGFIGSTYVRLFGGEHDIVVLDKLTYAGRRENVPGRRGARGRRHRGPRRGDAGRRGRGRRRELRRRVARGPFDRRSGRVRAHARDRHRRAARRRARAGRAALPPGLHRRGLRLDRRGLVHRELTARPVVPLLRDQGRGRPARVRAPPHLRHRGRDLPRLEQLRPAPVPGEADPARDPERDPRRPAARVRRRPPGAQLALRGGLLPRHPHRARARPAGRGVQRRRPGRVREHRRGARASSS